MSAASELPESLPGGSEGGKGEDFVRRVAGWARRGYWLVPALLALCLGVYRISAVQMWRDELATYSAIDRSPSELWSMLGHVDASSGAYYFFLQQWAGVFGHSITMLRMPSALAMAGAAAFTALAGAKMFNRRVGATAGLLFAIIPAVSRYAQEARAYAIVVMAVAAASWLLLRVLERPGWRRWLPYGLAIAAVGLFHMIALAILAAHAAIVAERWWGERGRRLPVGFLVTAVLAVLPALPIALAGSRQVGRQLGWISEPDLAYVANPFWPGLFGSSWVSLCVLVMAVLPAAWPRGRRKVAAAAALAVLPIIVLWVASKGPSHYFLDRYLLFTLPGWALLAAIGLCAVRPRILLPLGLAGVLLVSYGDQLHLRQMGSRETFDVQQAAAVIDRGYQPGDAMMPVSGDLGFLQVGTSLRYYLPKGRTPVDPEIVRTAAQVGDLVPQLSGNPTPGYLAVAKRIWVVTLGNGQDPYTGLWWAQLQTLQHYHQVKVTQVPGMQVTLVERND